MEKGDLPALERRLSELAEAFAGRAVTKGALRVWMDTLAESRFDDVQRVLSDWPKTNVKMPAPADILKLCRSEVSRRLEEQAEQDRRETPTVRSVLAHAPVDTELAKRELAKIWEILRTPRPGPKEWARVLRVREESGEHVDVTQSRLWRQALRETV